MDPVANTSNNSHRSIPNLPHLRGLASSGQFIGRTKT